MKKKQHFSLKNWLILFDYSTFYRPILIDNGRNFLFCITGQFIFSFNRHMELCTRCTDLCSICTEASNIAIDTKALWLLRWTEKCCNNWWNKNQRNHIYIKHRHFVVVVVTILSNQCYKIDLVSLISVSTTSNSIEINFIYEFFLSCVSTARIKF